MLPSDAHTNVTEALFLARLAHALTVCARGDTYEAGTDNVKNPPLLRAYNELLHRVTAAITQRLSDTPGFSVDAIVEMVQSFGEQNKGTGVTWAVQTAERKT